METTIHVLHLEDEAADAELVQAMLADADLVCRITRVETRDELENALRDGEPDIILADYRLPLYDGLSALRLVRERRPDVPFIFVSGTMGEEAAIEALTEGATDYVLKQDLGRLVPAVRRALQEAQNQREHRRSQEALLSFHEMLRAIIEAAPVAIVGLDLDGRVHSVWNPAAERMLGWEAREVMGKPLPSVPQESREEFRRFRERMSGGSPLDGVEVRRQRRDGTPIDYSIYASPLHDSDGRVSGNIAVLVDVTERKRADAALKASEARYMDLYENAPDLYVSVDARTATIEKCNQTLADTLGHPKEEIVGRTVFEIYHRDCLDQAKAAFQEFLRAGEVHDLELQLRRQDASKLDVSLNATAVRDEDGTILSSRMTLRDITERRQASRINAARIHLMDFAATHSMDELLEETLNEAEKLSDSQIGFYHTVNDDQESLTLQAWSTHTKAEFCRAEGKGLHYPIAEAGVWVDCVDQRKPVVHNDYMSLAHRKGLPEGHAEVIRELVVPILRGGKVKAILGVGNKAIDYTERDVEAISRLADLAWDIAERKRTEEQVALLSFALDGIHEAAFLIDKDACIQYVNNEACRMLGYSQDELLTMKVGDFNPALSADRWPTHWEDLREQGSLTFESELKTRDGRLLPVEINANYFEYEGRSYDLGLLRDITERKQAERERLATLRYFECLDKVNRAIQGADDLENMMKDLLDVVLSAFDCDRAFLMYPCDPDADTWTSPMERTRPEYPGIFELGIELPVDPQVAEAQRVLLAADGPVTFGPGNDHALPEDVSRQFGIKTFMSMALHPRIGSPWHFGIHQCSHARAWTAEEKRLFLAIGRRLADGLSSLLSIRDSTRNERFLNSIVEHIPSMIFVKDAQTLEFVRFNRAGEELLGYSREELLGRTDHDFFPREEADSFTAKDRQTLDRLELVDIPEETIRSRDEEERVLHTRKIPILDDAGAPQFLLGISEDITERKKAEETVRKLSEAIEQSPVSIAVTDRDGTIQYVNPAFEHTSGYSRKEIVGQKPAVLKSGKHDEAFYQELWATILRGEVWSGRFINKRKDGTLYEEEASISPIRDASGTITNFVTVKRDITREIDLERQLRQAQKLEAIGTLAGGIAHDFNNILTAIIGYGEMMQEFDVPESSDARPRLDQVLGAAYRAKDLVRQILTFSRQTEQEAKPVLLAPIVKEALKLLRASTPSTIDLRQNIQVSAATVMADPTHVHQVTMNLCTNAIQAIGSDGGRLTVELDEVKLDPDAASRFVDITPGRYARLRISDTGCGIDPGILSRVFEPYFTTKDPGEGTGLGLAVTHGIVRGYRGTITVESDPGEGSTFEVLLPLVVDLTDEKPMEAATAVPGGRGRILFVDDEEALAEFGRDLLVRLGYDVTTRTSSVEALAAFRQDPGRFDLVIADHIMPNMTGLSLAREIARIRSDLPVVLCTGFMGPVTPDAAKAAGVREVLQKPLGIRELAEVTSRLLGEDNQPGG